MGALHGEWRINLLISPTTWFVCFISFAMVFFNYKGNIEIHSVWCSGWSGTAYGCSKVGFTPRPIRYRPHNLLVSSSGALKSVLHIRAELDML